MITFLDILGFRNLVATRSAAEVESIVRLARSNASSRPSDDYPECEHTLSVTFSDSVIRIRHYDTDICSGAFFHEILNLVHAQAELAARGILIRGGVTAGEIYARGDNIFGPGFMRAYELESEFANYPRIIVGSEVLAALRADRRLRKEDHELADEIHYLRELLRRGDDGHWFVDYLRAFEGEMDYPENYPDYLAQPRRLVVTRASEVIRVPRALQKYLWLARYHNAVCEEVSAEDRLLIDASDIPALDALDDVSPNIRS